VTVRQVVASIGKPLNLRFCSSIIGLPDYALCSGTIRSVFYFD